MTFGRSGSAPRRAARLPLTHEPGNQLPDCNAKAEAAAKRLEEFEAGPWGRKYLMIAQSWRRNWEQIIPFCGFAPEVRKIIYTTNAIESLHMQLRKVRALATHRRYNNSLLLHSKPPSFAKLWRKRRWPTIDRCPRCHRTVYLLEFDDDETIG